MAISHSLLDNTLWSKQSGGTGLVIHNIWSRSSIVPRLQWRGKNSSICISNSLCNRKKLLHDRDKGISNHHWYHEIPAVLICKVFYPEDGPQVPHVVSSKTWNTHAGCIPPAAMSPSAVGIPVQYQVSFIREEPECRCPIKVTTKDLRGSWWAVKWR